MRFNKGIIVILLLLLICLIPIGFASDSGVSPLQNDCSNGMMVNDDAIDDDIVLDSSGNILNANNKESGEENDASSLSEASSLNGSLNSNSYLNSNSSSGSNEDSDLPSLDIRFSQIEIECSDENTIFVNSSYEGEEENGTQSNPFKTIQNGLNYIRDQSDKINLFISKGHYDVSSTLGLNDSINIIGEDPQNTIIDGLNSSTIFRISSGPIVNLINLTLVNGLSQEGGAICLSRSYLNLINVIFYDNHVHDISLTSTGKGGAIYNEAGVLRIYNSTFSNNSAYGKYSKFGGAVYNHLGNVSLFNSKFINNSLQGDWASGGAIYNFNGFLTLFNSSICNTCLDSSYNSLGGAICNWNGRNTFIINSTISGNRLTGKYAFGSAIANKGVLLKVINSTISDNSAEGTSAENSTVWNLNGICSFENTIFSNNSIDKVNSSLLLCIEDQLIVSESFDDSSYDLPSKYDLRDEGLITSVKNQKPGGDCWAFAIYGALESYLLKTENISYDFSENNMKNSMYSKGIYGTEGDSGGNHIMAFAYLLRGSGPVDESLDSFDAYSSISSEDLPISKYVTGFKYIPLRLNPLDNGQIKQAILQYGALYTSIYSGIFSGYNGYSIFPSINQHAVAIVGWDDNYSASNFGTTPPGDGAWIIKNSWGKYSGQNGYYYVSYYDSTFPGVTDQFAAIAFTSVDNISEYEGIYQYDLLGNTYESLGYNSNTAWLANQFIANSSNPLKAFGLYTFGSSSYLVNVTVNGVSKLVQDGVLEGAGYHTVRFNELIDLIQGDVFRISVRLTTPGSLFPIAIESKRSDYSLKVGADLNQSFISPDGIEWYDIAKDTVVPKFYEDLNKVKLFKTNVCLKAYTEYADDLSIEILPNSSIYREGELIEFNVTVSNRAYDSGEVNVSSILDESASIVSYVASKGTFDMERGVWTIDNIGYGEKESLILVLAFNEYREFIETSFSLNSASYSSKKDISNSSVLSYGSHTEFMKIGSISTSVNSAQPVAVALLDAFGKPLSNMDVTVSLLSSNNGYSMNPLLLNTQDGSSKFNISLPYGKYVFRLSFEGEGHLDAADASFDVDVIKTSTQIIASGMTCNSVVTAIDGRIGKYLKMTLKDRNGNPLSGKKLSVIINAKEYFLKTNKSGVAALQINTAVAGSYIVKISFSGDERYASSSKTVKVYVKKQSLKLSVPNRRFKLKNKGKYLTAILKNSKGKALKNKKLTFTINGRKYTARTNSKGIAKVKLSLQKKKNYKFTVRFAGDKSYNAISKKAKVIVK